MKFLTSALLISAALATIASAAPLISSEDIVPSNSDATINSIHLLNKRCGDCTQTDGLALDLIVQASADHYASIAHRHLDNLMIEIETAKVTSGNQELPQEKAALNVAVQAKIDGAKQACAPEALAPVIKATVTANSNMDVPWSKKEEIEKKMADFDIMITNVVLDRIQSQVNAEGLSKDCTEKMTNTDLAPAPAGPAPAAPVPAPAAVPETPAPAPAEVPAPPAPAPAETEPQAGIDVKASVDPKFVCKSGCKDSADAHTVLTLRVNLENEFQPRLTHFYQQEVPTACTENRSSLLGGVLSLIADLNVKANANAQA